MKYAMRNILATVALLSLAGCAHKPGEILSTTQTVIGIDISQSPDSQTPHVRLGFIRSQFHVVPTSTNGPISAPAVDSSIAVNQRLTSTDIAEDFRTGSATQVATSNTVAKAARAAAPPPKK